MPSTPRFNWENVDSSPLSHPLPFTFSGRISPNWILKGAMSEHLSSFSLQNVQNFGASAGVQITQLSHDIQPTNLCLEENVTKVFGALGEWMAVKKDDVELCGFPVLSGYEVPCNTEKTVL